MTEINVDVAQYSDLNGNQKHQEAMETATIILDVINAAVGTYMALDYSAFIENRRYEPARVLDSINKTLNSYGISFDPFKVASRFYFIYNGELDKARKSNIFDSNEDQTLRFPTEADNANIQELINMCEQLNIQAGE